MREIIIKLDGQICSRLQIPIPVCKQVIELRAWRQASQHCPKGRCLREIIHISPRLIDIRTQEA